VLVTWVDAVLRPGAVAGSVGQVALTAGGVAGGLRTLAAQVGSSLGASHGLVLFLALHGDRALWLGLSALDAGGLAVLRSALPGGAQQLVALYLADDRSGNSVSPTVPVV
jgi:hypothetical protein